MPSKAFSIAHPLRDGASGVTSGIRAGQGHAVVLVHGVGMAAEIWSPQIEELSRHYDVIAYDMLGHGGSSLPPSDPQLTDYADQLRAVMDGLGIAQANVVGHSMGALVVLEFALMNPDRVAKVVALNAVYCRNPEQRAAVQSRAALLKTGGPLGAVDATIARWFGDPVSDRLEVAAGVTRRLLDSVDKTGYARTYGLFARADDAHSGRLQNLRAPGLFMTGDADPNSTPDMSRAMAAAAPNALCEIVSGERHMMALTAADDINRRLISFLADNAAKSIDVKSFRRALGAFSTGVTVVATLQPDGTPRGFTANSFTSVSLDPPLVLVCIAKTASGYGVFAEAAQFSISVLAESQRDTSGLFASKAMDKFERAAWRRSAAAGTPIIDGAAAWFDCRTHSIVDAGDHAILIGRVLDFGDSDANPLGYCRGAYVTFSLSQAAMSAPGSRTRVGAILENDDGILFVAGGDGRIDLPEGISLEPESDPASLKGTLQRLGIAAQLGFLFAVFEDPRSGAGSVSVYYRGSVKAPLPEGQGLTMIPFADIPWANLRDDAVRSMLRRYVRERSEDAFGIYIGDAEHGTVRTLAKPA